MPTPPPLNPPSRVLMGPGPSDVPPSVLRALAAPTVGHLDPVFLAAMDEVRDMLRTVIGTENQLTFPVSGTGSSGMEACFVNLVEPGDRVLVGENGVFGKRMAEVAARAGAEVTTVEAPWGRTLDPDDMRRAANGRHFKIVAVVHAETSTGVLQPLEPIRALADEIGALLLVDAVTSIGGCPIDADRLRIDALYAGTQKCLSCPPGLSPVSLSNIAVRVLERRRRPVQSWYLDLGLVRQYWGAERVYHHTAPVNMVYALHEALRLVLEEGLEQRFARHRIGGRALARGLEALGLKLRVDEAERLPQLTTVALPEGLDDRAARRALLDRFGLEIGGGLGPMKGNTWRIGLMGQACTRRNVTLCLSALQAILAEQGVFPVANPLDAADRAWAETQKLS